MVRGGRVYCWVPGFLVSCICCLPAREQQMMGAAGTRKWSVVDLRQLHPEAVFIDGFSHVPFLIPRSPCSLGTVFVLVSYSPVLETSL